MSDISMDNQSSVPFSMDQLQQYINTQVQAQLGAIQNGQHMGQQQNNGVINGARPSKPTRYDGSLGTDPTV